MSKRNSTLRRKRYKARKAFDEINRHLWPWQRQLLSAFTSNAKKLERRLKSGMRRRPKDTTMYHRLRLICEPIFATLPPEHRTLIPIIYRRG